MAYEPGSYTRELRGAHQRGEHVLDEDSNCPACNYREVPSGFASLAEYDAVMEETALDLQGHVDAHWRGEHKRRPVDACIECARAEG